MSTFFSVSFAAAQVSGVDNEADTCVDESCAMGYGAGGSLSPASLEATLAPGESIVETKTVDLTDLPPRADVVFSFDLTGSMGGTISAAKAKAMEVMNNLAATGVDINYGVMSYMDYPNSYTSYGYSSTYGTSGDYAYQLNQSVTGDAAAVQYAINSLMLGNGADGAEDYTRPLYESYADSNIDWRPGAKKILINFADNVPHDNDLNEGVPGTSGTWTTGGDPGRDEIMFTADDLDLQTVLSEMASNKVTLLEAHATSWLKNYWDYWTGITGGSAFVLDSSTFTGDVVNAITAALTTPDVSGLHLQASAGYESWIEKTEPASYSGPTGVSVVFELTLKVPEGTPEGTYNFTVSAVDADGVSYGDQSVTIHVTGANTVGKVTGGGWISAAKKKDGKSFGFEAQYNEGDAAPSGQVEFNDHATGLKFHSNEIASLHIDPATHTAAIKGKGSLNGEAGHVFEVVVSDQGEPGTSDTFSISIDGSPVAAGTLAGGNIQIHK